MDTGWRLGVPGGQEEGFCPQWGGTGSSWHWAVGTTYPISLVTYSLTTVCQARG